MIKMIKMFTQSNTYGENSAINVNITSNKFVIINLSSLIYKNLKSIISIFTAFPKKGLLVTEEIDTAAVSQLIYNFCFHHRLEMSYKSTSSK